jgi:hypothetical protein
LKGSVSVPILPDSYLNLFLVLVKIEARKCIEIRLSGVIHHLRVVDKSRADSKRPSLLWISRGIHKCICVVHKYMRFVQQTWLCYRSPYSGPKTWWISSVNAGLQRPQPEGSVQQRQMPPKRYCVGRATRSGLQPSVTTYRDDASNREL